MTELAASPQPGCRPPLALMPGSEALRNPGWLRAAARTRLKHQSRRRLWVSAQAPGNSSYHFKFKEREDNCSVSIKPFRWTFSPQWWDNLLSDENWPSAFRLNMKTFRFMSSSWSSGGLTAARGRGGGRLMKLKRWSCWKVTGLLRAKSAHSCRNRTVFHLHHHQETRSFAADSNAWTCSSRAFKRD